LRKAARENLTKDHHDRTYGYAVDSTGAVARAIERAYLEGFADAQGEPQVGSACKVSTGERSDGP
jgi:hypothetical protein